MWPSEQNSNDWCESVVVTIYKQADGCPNEQYGGIRYVGTVSKLLASTILRRLSDTRKRGFREVWADISPDRVCNDHIFTLHLKLESTHMFIRFKIPVFLDLKSTFDSVGRAVLWSCFSSNGVPEKSISFIQSVYRNSRNRVPAYGHLSPRFTSKSGFRQGWPFSILLLTWLHRQSCSLVTIVAFIFAQKGIILTWNMRTMLCYRVWTQICRRTISIVLTMVRVCLACVLPVRSVKCCCGSGLTQSWILFLKRNNYFLWTDLVNWRVEHRMKCLRACRRPDWYLLMWVIRGLSVTYEGSSY